MTAGSWPVGPSSEELVASCQAELGEDRQRDVRRRRRLGTTIGAALLATIMSVAVLDGLDVVDVVGVDDRTVSAVVGPLELEVRYPSVTRPALAAPFEIVVRRQGGFDGPVEIAVDARYLMAWDVNGVLPVPAGETSDGDVVVWEFDPPPSEVLHVRYDGRIEPARQEGATGRVAVVDGAAELVAVSFETRVMP